MVSPLKQLINREFPQGDYEVLNANHSLQWKKHYLSFDREQGWKIVRLNLFQQLARSLLGSYASTHLKNVIPFIYQEKDLDLGF